MGTGTVSQPADFYVAPFAWLHGYCRATQDLCYSDTFLRLLYTLGRHAVPPCRFGTVHVFLLKCVPPVSLEVFSSTISEAFISLAASSPALWAESSGCCCPAEAVGLGSLCPAKVLGCCSLEIFPSDGVPPAIPSSLWLWN